ncbi:MAG: hypothetical protein WBL80_09375 [Erysipelotrichaceae bacterium]
MEQLVTKAYYADTFKGALIPEGERDSTLQIAELQLNDLTRNRIVADLPSTLLEKAKTAICFQADFHYRNGGDMGDVAGFSVDGISVSYQQGASLKHISENARLLLKSAGLISRIL